MSLFVATLLAASISLVIGLALFMGTRLIQEPLKKFPRSQNAAYITVGLAGAWLLLIIAQLGPSDYGEFKNYIFIIFLAGLILSFHFVPDFLPVRGLCGIILLAADHFVSAAYLQEPASRLFMVGFTYLWIVLALFLSIYPYRWRDFFGWLFLKRQRSQIFGLGFFAYAVVLFGVAFSYGQY